MTRAFWQFVDVMVYVGCWLYVVWAEPLVKVFTIGLGLLGLGLWWW